MTTQAARKASTRQVLLDAAADLLVEDGLAGFTTAAVTQRASLSNGALFGHFPTRLDLLAATVEHILARLRHDYDTTFTGLLEDSAEPVTLLEMLWSSMTDPHFGAVLGVYTQARTDGELLAAIHDIVVRHGSYVGEINRRVARTFAPDPERAARLSTVGTLAIVAMQGLVVSHMVGASMGGERDLIGAFANLYDQARAMPLEAQGSAGTV
jgi:AcrR family transcriptional regulator